ncbi:MAG: hypothetical protein M1828_000762 [Chrysothrix sp. TS-e1954]|nr:MAG: hypothetical protein M1828_000762 [Chrysothrix sp. TS-e1954]
MIGGQRVWLLAALGFCAFVATLIVFRPTSSLEPYIQRTTHAAKERLGFHDEEDEEPLTSAKLNDKTQTKTQDGKAANVVLDSLQPSRALEDDVYNSTLGFEKLLVINLPDRTDHKDELTIAGSLLDIHFDFIPGIRGEDVPDKALPPPGDQRERFHDGNVGSWRAHMSAIQTVLQENYTSAVIFEDDIDFDVRIKDQLTSFAAASRALTQPLKNSPNTYADPTLPHRNELNSSNALEHDLSSTNSPTTAPPTYSPYGDNWDVLWLGHCAALFPKPDQPIPQARYTIPNDPTVPLWGYNNSGKAHDEKPEAEYPEHTRVVHHARRMICTFAYAISHRGAQRLLYDLGVAAFKDPFDVALAIWCEEKGTCLTVQPQLISLYRAPGAMNKDSDIHPNSGQEQIREQGSSPYIRRSVKLNMGRLVEGQEELIDQYPDYDAFRSFDGDDGDSGDGVEAMPVR